MAGEEQSMIPCEWPKVSGRDRQLTVHPGVSAFGTIWKLRRGDVLTSLIKPCQAWQVQDWDCKNYWQECRFMQKAQCCWSRLPRVWDLSEERLDSWFKQAGSYAAPVLTQSLKTNLLLPGGCKSGDIKLNWCMDGKTQVQFLLAAIEQKEVTAPWNQQTQKLLRRV